MPTHRAYVIVCHAARLRPRGRHRAGTPGLRPYRPGPIRRPGAAARPARAAGGGPWGRRPRHARRPGPLTGEALSRYATLTVLIVTVLVSGWFAATGAAAFAQMGRP
ncbi:MAG TPA: hypothetical protein VNV66_04635 [Pilimelia sp.]|nr:hypothetical protein [Pilimelia sp.]